MHLASFVGSKIQWLRLPQELFLAIRKPSWSFLVSPKWWTPTFVHGWFLFSKLSQHYNKFSRLGGCQCNNCRNCGFWTSSWTHSEHFQSWTQCGDLRSHVECLLPSAGLCLVWFSFRPGDFAWRVDLLWRFCWEPRFAALLGRHLATTVAWALSDSLDTIPSWRCGTRRPFGWMEGCLECSCGWLCCDGQPKQGPTFWPSVYPSSDVPQWAPLETSDFERLLLEGCSTQARRTWASWPLLGELQYWSAGPWLALWFSRCQLASSTEALWGAAFSISVDFSNFGGGFWIRKTAWN